MSEPTSKHKEESAVQQALDSPATAKGLDDSYQPVPDVRDDPAYFARLYDQYATDVLRVCYFYLSDREKAEKDYRYGAHYQNYEEKGQNYLFSYSF